MPCPTIAPVRALYALLFTLYIYVHISVYLMTGTDTPLKNILINTRRYKKVQ